ncbi:MAG: DUF2868 domain-containing protein [Magnetospiraceae bacterium]
MPETPMTTPGPTFPTGLTRDRLRAEAARHFEAARTGPLEDDGAVERAKRQGGDFESRVILRAQALPVSQDLEEALDSIRNGLRVSMILAILLAALAGGLAAQAVFAGGGTVNFFGAAVGLLAAPTLTLLFWGIIVILQPDLAQSGSLGGWVARAGLALARRFRSGPAMLAGLRAIAGMTRGAVGTWTASALSHGLWTAFLTGALAMTLVMLSLWRVDFVWQTTILTDATFIVWTDTLAALPGALGFTVPDAAEIAASQDTGGPARGAWAGLLIGCLVVYGLLPRLILLGATAFLARRARGRIALETMLPGYERLRARLMPDHQILGIVDPDPGTAPPPATPHPSVRIEGKGPVAIAGFEIPSPLHWPPTRPRAPWRDLGFVESRADRQRLLDSLGDMRPPPRALVVVCDRAGTPDRGTAAFFGEIRDAAPCPHLLILSGPARGDRDRHWQELADTVGMTALILDLDRPDPAQVADLGALLALENAS